MAIINYSDLLKDDGAFEDINNKLDELEKRIKDLASSKREKINLVNPEDTDLVKKYYEETIRLKKEIDNLKKARKESEKLEKKMNKTKRDSIKVQVDLRNNTKENIKAQKELKLTHEDLRRMYERALGTLSQNIKSLNNYKNELKNLKVEYKKGRISQEQFLLKEAELKTAISQTNIIIKQQTKERQLAIGSAQKYQTQLGLLNRAIRELNDSERETDWGQTMIASQKALREEVKNFNESLGNYHDSVGNYGKAFEKAGSALLKFGSGIPAIDKSLNVLNESLVRLVKGQENATKASTKLGVGMRRLGNIAKGTGILLIITLIASVGASLKQGDEGAKKMATAMAYLKAGISVVIQTLVGLRNNFQILGKQIEIIGLQIMRALTFDKTKIENYNVSINNLKVEISGLRDEMSKQKTFMEIFNEEMEKAKEISESFAKTFDIRREIMSSRNSLNQLIKEYEKYNFILNDATKSRREQDEASRESDERELAIINKKIEIARKEFKLAQTEARKMRLESMGGGSIEADEKEFEAEQKIQDLLREKSGIIREQAKFARERIIEEYQLNIKTALSVTRFNRDELQKRIKDERLSNEERVRLSKEFVKTFSQSIEETFKAYSEASKRLGEDVDLQLKDGKIFLNQQELQINNAVKLKEQLSELNLPESMIESLLDYSRRFRMNTNAINEMKEAIEGIDSQLRKLKSDSLISEEELQGLRLLNDELREINSIEITDSNIEDIIKQREELKNKIKEIEDNTKKIIEDSKIERLKLDVDTLNEELENLEENSIRKEQVLKEIADKEIEIEKIKNAQLLREQKKQDDKEKALLEKKKKRQEEQVSFFKDLGNQITSAFVERADERVKKQEETIIKQNQAVDEQRRRAEQGLSNTLAFEQKELAKAEKEKLRLERRQRLAKKVEAFWNLVTSYSKDSKDGNAILKAMRDIAVGESIEATLGFKKGGYTGDGGTSEVAGEVHGQEFVIDAPTTKLLGLRNKSMADFKEMLFTTDTIREQRNNFERSLSLNFVRNDNSDVVNKIDELKDVIMSRPTQLVNVQRVANDVLEFVEDVRFEGKKTRNTFAVKKNRF